MQRWVSQRKKFKIIFIVKILEYRKKQSISTYGGFGPSQSKKIKQARMQ